MELLASIVGYIIVGVSALGVVGVGLVWLFKRIFDNWLNSKFSEQLEAFKHRQQIEIERLRFSINALMDRATRLHQRKFEVLPKVWGRLTDAHGIILSVVSKLQATPDLDSMLPAQAEEYLANSKLVEWQREKVRISSKKTDEFRKQIEPHKIARGKKALKKYYLLYKRNSIFIRPSIKSKFDLLDRLMVDALSEHEMNFVFATRTFTSIEKLEKEGESLFKELQTEVQERLWDSTDDHR